MTNRPPPPTLKGHERFCEIEGWRRARGRTGTRHLTFELTLATSRADALARVQAWWTEGT